MIRKMTAADWDAVCAIYSAAIKKGLYTFNKTCPDYEGWDAVHHKDCRFVAVEDGKVVGFSAVSQTIPREPYRGVVEVSVYVDEEYQNRGIGTALLNKLIEDCPNHGFWSMFSIVISHNASSLALHKKCGFREIGYRERIAQDIFGEWQDTIMLEYRL